MNQTSSVEGTIAPIDYHGRILSPYHSYYKDVDVNDVRLKDRTYAREGTYRWEEDSSLRSDISKAVTMNISKPAGTNEYLVWFDEQWPVVLKTSKSLEYSGRNINNREFAGNNLDFAGQNLLYNPTLSEEWNATLRLVRMNASVMATDHSILAAALRPTRDLDVRSEIHTTGIADLSYRQTGPDYLLKRGDYPVLNEGDERYYGTFDIYRNIRLSSKFENKTKPDDWLPCCTGGWASMKPYDRKGFGSNAAGIFDCTCYPVG
jgi:hypothetical protein